MKNHPESGSAVFYILIAVALFAALSFAVANMMRAGGSRPNTELMELRASEILQYSGGLRRAVQQMKISGVPDAEISFETATLGGYANPNCLEARCKLFDPSGGGIVYSEPPAADWLDTSHAAALQYGRWYVPNNVCAVNAGNGGAGCDSDTADNEDLVLFLPWIKKDICIAINSKLGVTNPGGNPPQEAGDAWPGGYTQFTGSYADGVALEQNGLRAGCFEGSSGGVPPEKSYAFFQVLLAR